MFWSFSQSEKIYWIIGVSEPDPTPHPPFKNPDLIRILAQQNIYIVIKKSEKIKKFKTQRQTGYVGIFWKYCWVSPLICDCFFFVAKNNFSSNFPKKISNFFFSNKIDCKKFSKCFFNEFSSKNFSNMFSAEFIEKTFFAFFSARFGNTAVCNIS